MVYFIIGIHFKNEKQNDFVQVEIEVAFYLLKQKHRKAILGLRHPVTIVKYSSDVPGPYCMAAVDKFGLQF